MQINKLHFIFVIVINKMLAISYKEIEVAAKLITRKRNIKQAHELISTTLIEMYDKTCPLDKEGFIKWFVKSMHNYFCWSNSRFNKDTKINDTQLPIDYQPIAEDNSLEEKKLKTLILFKKSLPSHERELFTLYYELGLSCREMAIEINKTKGMFINRNRVSTLLKPVKLKFESVKWK